MKGGELATEKNADLGCDGTNTTPEAVLPLSGPGRDLPDITAKANGRAGCLLRSQHGGGVKKFAGIDATCDGQQGIECACSGVGDIRAWHCARLWAASIASPLSAHKATLSASISDNSVRIARSELI